jgi:hypothetical protein
MRKFVLPLILVASLGASSLAMAAASSAQGTIKAIDAKALTLTLDNGTVYKLPASFKVADLKTGEKVKVTWQKMGTANDASAVTVIK